MKKPMTSYPKEKIRVVLLEDIHPAASAAFRKAGYQQIERLKRSANGEELLGIVREAHILGIRSKTQLEASVLAEAGKLMAVGCFCIGTNQVDLSAATERGIPVFNSPYSNTRSVAELVIAESIMLMRRIPERSEAAHAGQWLKDARRSYEVRGKVMGIVGYGHIGSQVSVLAEALGFKVIFYDIAPVLPLGNARAVRSLPELLRAADVVTLHVPGGRGTEGMISARAIRQMKKGAVLLNLARGGVVDTQALKTALESGHLGGASVDVHPVEPKANSDRFASPLQGLPNVLLTPHIGGSTQEAQQQIALDVSGKLLSYLETGNTTNSHSVPALSLPVQENSHRILHIHWNRPGVLSAINAALSTAGINITGQYLATNERIGYVVLDVDSNSSRKALEHLREVPHTLRSRVLY
jgi:D-3-phosphoglycerate dehydrogenase